jgi:Fe-S-cluster-containing hydrogenase component 2
MIVFDEEQKKAFKCDFCGGNPQCVKICPMHALGIVSF